MAIDSQPPPSGAVQGVKLASDQILHNDARRAEVDAQYSKVCQNVLIWEVVGGGKDGGIMVREGCSLKSPELRQRLATGSLVRELAEKGERLCYQLLSGSGPQAGWVSIKVKNTEMLASVSKKPTLEGEVQLLTRRLAMLPLPLHKVLSFPELSCKQITEQIYEPRVGCLDRLAKENDNEWMKAAMLKKPLEPFAFQGFSPNDGVLKGLLADERLTPLQRCFPRVGPNGTEYVPSMDPVTGLMPDTVSALYFLEDVKETKDTQVTSLRGIVRFGAQATQSMSRGEPEEDGEFAPGVHGGAEAMVLADAAVYFARLAWNPNAMLKKISCQFSKPCPCFQSLEISVNLGLSEDFQYGSGIVTAKINLKLEKNLISFGEALLVSFPNKPMRVPANLPKISLAPPGVEWVPPELAQSRLPAASTLKPYNKEEYMAAAFQLPCMRFPKSCAAVEELGRQEQERQRGRQKHVRANRPVRGGEMRNDLCFPGGLTPAAIAFEKYFEKASGGILFDGILKLGPQASDALFLASDRRSVLDGSMSIVAHSGMALAALDDHLAHLPRCDGREKTSITWKLDLESHALLPIGQELDFECFCPFVQTGPVGNYVTGEIRYENEVLATLSAVITSSDRETPTALATPATAATPAT